MHVDRDCGVCEEVNSRKSDDIYTGQRRQREAKDNHSSPPVKSYLKLTFWMLIDHKRWIEDRENCYINSNGYYLRVMEHPAIVLLTPIEDSIGNV